MKNLKTVTQVFAGGKWLPAGSPLPGDLPNFDYEKHAAKGLIEDTEGGEIHNPSAQVEVSESVADPEMSGLRQQLADTQRERDALTAQLAEAQALPVLPADARERLIKINGVAEKLAGTILDALTAPAKVD